MSTQLDIRPSPIAGQWYEGNPKSLTRRVDAYLDGAVLPALQGEILGVVAPHAGHLYSGRVAGYAFAALRGRTPGVVAVISPYHNFHPAALLTSAHTAYETPLGVIPIQRSLVERLDADLQRRLGFGLTPVSRDPEHSLEIELPFLQRTLASEWQLLPVMVRAQDPHVSCELGMALAAVLTGQNAVLVASTDLSHYYDQPAALAFDHTMLSKIESFDPQGMFQAERTGEGFACGLGALAAVLWASRELGADSVTILQHATSGDVTGDFDAVVGYAAAAIMKTR